MDGKRYGFFLMALHSDWRLLYDPECEKDDSRDSLYGMTLVAFNFSSLDRIKYNGLCLRSKFVPVNKDVIYKKVRSDFVFRDHVGNFRNFEGHRIHVTVETSEKVSRKMPMRANGLESFYRHETIIEPLDCRNETNATNVNDSKFVPFFQRLTIFALEQLYWMDSAAARDKSRKIKIFHKLPNCTVNWLTKQWSDLYDGIEFVAVSGEKIKVEKPITSEHCRKRSWHSVAMCEICLFDEYGPRLIDALLNNETIAASSQNECGGKTN